MCRFAFMEKQPPGSQEQHESNRSGCASIDACPLPALGLHCDLRTTTGLLFTIPEPLEPKWDRPASENGS
jgi:hypothetical protein